MPFGLNTYDAVETAAGTFYAFQLFFTAESWLMKNMGQDSVTPQTIFLCQVMGAVIFALRFHIHHARIVGKKQPCNGISVDLINAMLWYVRLISIEQLE